MERRPSQRITKPTLGGVATDRVTQLIIELWSRTRIDWGYASERLTETFRKHTGLGSRERREIAETLFGMIRMTRRVDLALEQAGARPAPGPGKEMARLWAYRVLHGDDATTVLARARAAMPAIDWVKVSEVDGVIEHERDPVKRLALSTSLPDWLAARLQAQYGEHAPELAAALNARAPLNLRANRVKTSRMDLAVALAEENVQVHPTRYAADGLRVDGHVNAFGLRCFKDGRFEVQDEASQLVAELVAPPARGLVVDFCAGAGGKTLALGALMNGTGRLLALDIDERKLIELRKRARRAGLNNVRALVITPSGGLPDELLALTGKVDRVVVDAPCSGIGALRRNPEARWRLAENDVDRLPPQQEAILHRAAPLVAVGGRLIYATCTILAEENEAVIKRFLAAHPAGTWERVGPVEILSRERGAPLAGGDAGLALVTLPHVHDTDGFYAAVLRRRV
jgi:16S rRNA (cytosine967-C5)-methyltransferase